MTERLYDLAALDMDGTLLNSQHETTPFTRDALARVDAAGKVIALCTGRCMSELWEHLKSLQGVRYVIGENGGCLYDVRADRVLRQSVIGAEAAERLLSLGGQYDVLIQSFIGGQSCIQLEDLTRFDHWHMADFASVFIAGSLFTGDLRALWRERNQPMEKLNFYFARPADKEDFRRRMGDMDLCLSHSLGIGYEISPRDATKALGLQALCRHLNIPVARTMAVGDGANDVELMEAAGLSVAMGNAVEAVRAVADAFADDCDHDGAAKAVLRYMLGEEQPT